MEMKNIQLRCLFNFTKFAELLKLKLRVAIL